MVHGLRHGERAQAQGLCDRVEPEGPRDGDEAGLGLFERHVAGAHLLAQDVAHLDQKQVWGDEVVARGNRDRGLPARLGDHPLHRN